MAPKGNKNAVGNCGGRPRLYHPEEEAKAIDEWSKLDNSINLVGFCVYRDICPDYIYDWEKESTEFSQALKKAKARLADRREKMMNENKLNYGSFNRYQSVFDPFLYKHEDNLKAREAELKANADSKSQQPVNINIVDYSKAKE